MELKNEFTVPAPVSEVWKTLLDVKGIAPCIPGATVDRVEDDEVAGRVKIKVGPITASYAGTARFVAKDESAHRFVLDATGRETRGSGRASATVEVQMSEQASSTHVTVGTTLEISGRQAQFGRGVMTDVASKLTEQFAACLASKVSGEDAGNVAPDDRTSARPPAGATAAAAELAAAPPTASSQAAESLDLVSTVMKPVAKQAAPAVGGLVLGLVLGLLLGHRRQPQIVIAPAPPRAFPRARAAF